MSVVLPPKDEQQIIATFLDRETAKIDALITEQQRLIELLKEKRQAVTSHTVTKGLNPNAPMKDSGIEWLGEVPEHWEVKRLRFIAQLNPSKSEITELDRETEVSFLPMEAIGDDGSLNLERTRPIGEVETGYTYFREGDVTIAKITPCFENGKGAVMRGLFGGIGFGTTELIVARAKPFEATSNYLHWLFISTWFRKHGEASMYGAGGQKRVPDDFVRNYAIGFPSLEEQHTIVAFLDREIAKIDVLTTESKTAITLLQERRTALISAAVTGKIDVRGLVSAKTEVKAETVPC
jgi:type I restriction enzyme S subunit